MPNGTYERIKKFYDTLPLKGEVDLRQKVKSRTDYWQGWQGWQDQIGINTGCLRKTSLWNFSETPCNSCKADRVKLTGPCRADWLRKTHKIVRRPQEKWFSQDSHFSWDTLYKVTLVMLFEQFWHALLLAILACSSSSSSNSAVQLFVINA